MKLTPIQQHHDLVRRFPQFSGGVRGGVACWHGELCPSPLSATYRVEISYRLDTTPRVRVIAPELVLRPGLVRPPHTYVDGSLCLYLPRAKEWSHAMRIADTLVPWTCLWLAYYEAWVITGEWLGGGEHPLPRKRPPLMTRLARKKTDLPPEPAAASAPADQE